MRREKVTMQIQLVFCKKKNKRKKSLRNECVEKALLNELSPTVVRATLYSPPSSFLFSFFFFFLASNNCEHRDTSFVIIIQSIEPSLFFFFFARSISHHTTCIVISGFGPSIPPTQIIEHLAMHGILNDFVIFQGEQEEIHGVWE